jgi:hypothetical protein
MSRQTTLKLSKMLACRRPCLLRKRDSSRHLLQLHVALPHTNHLHHAICRRVYNGKRARLPASKEYFMCNEERVRRGVISQAEKQRLLAESRQLRRLSHRQ